MQPWLLARWGWCCGALLVPTIAAGAGLPEQGATDWMASANTSERSLSEFIGQQALIEGPPVTLEFFYGTTCVNCLLFLQNALAPLVKAQLPGGAVRLSLLPWVKGDYSEGQCTASDECFYALAPLCVLQYLLPQQPAPVDAPGVSRAVRFILCDQFHRMSAGPERARAAHEGSVRACAAEAGLPWDGPQGLARCARGPGAFAVLRSAAYASSIAAADRVISRGPDITEPFLLLNGDELRCLGDPVRVECTEVWSLERGYVPFAAHGNLLYIVCSKLDHPPEACRSVHGSAAPVTVRPTPACEDCSEVLDFRWQPQRQAWWASWTTASVLVSALTFPLLLATAAWRLTRAPNSQWAAAAEGWRAACTEVECL
eukprot:CAMPEP_0179025104 /NCGR_PEP_ID=MMETSP0796-20121207/7806_1 /TAXON_ID=73915 /ORGANISM="Pyrodinium bahamense, Strain pbaha01" /LENGTH=371 /DNA_ID=CAMNT_0020721101 /DNA_START=46 /DNA_END=1161 /DNA_ORIENTATION=+